MKRRSLLVVLAATVIAGVVLAAMATPGTIYTWEKTFEVGKPEIECKIEIGDCRIVGCPVRVWVCLRLDGGCWGEWKDECDYDWEGKFGDDDKCCGHPYMECGCQVNGTYSAHLYWWNETLGDFQHVMHLQEETNVTITCWKHFWAYTFTPMWEGEYKVVVTFEVESEIYNFTNED